MSEKCIINGCTNTKAGGLFIGDICTPCFEFISGRHSPHSQAFRNVNQIKQLREKLSQIQEEEQNAVDNYS